MAKESSKTPRRFTWPASESARSALRFWCWLAAVAWFMAAPVGALKILHLPGVLGGAVFFVAYALGFIVLGELSRAWRPLADVSADGDVLSRS